MTQDHKKHLSIGNSSLKIRRMLPYRIWALAILASFCVQATDLSWLVQSSPVAKADAEAVVCPINPANCCCPEVCRRLKATGRESLCHRREGTDGKQEIHHKLDPLNCFLRARCKDEGSFLNTTSPVKVILPNRLSLLANQGEASLYLALSKPHPLKGYQRPFFHPPSFA